MTAQLQEYLKNLNDNIANLRNKIDSMKLSHEEVRAIDNIPKEYIGKIIPAREAIEIVWPFYTERIQGNITISADGPFIANSIHFAYMFPFSEAVLGDNILTNLAYPFQGRWRQISSIESGINFRQSQNVDFYWEYEVTEAHRTRQNIRVPSSIVHQTELGNGYYPLVPCDVFKKTSTVTLYVTTLPKYIALVPDSPDDEPFQYVGIVWCGFNGYYVLEDY